MNRLIAWFTENPMASNLLMICIIIGGMLSLPGLEKEFFPMGESRRVLITAPYPGAAPINVEQQVCIRIENAIQDIEAIKEIATTARKNQCRIVVEMFDGYNINQFTNDIKNRVDAITSLPEETEPPRVSLLKNQNMMMFISLEGQVDELTLKRFAKEIQAEMEQLPYISAIDLDAVKPYEISIELDRGALQRYQLSFAEIEQAIRAASVDIPAGTIKASQGDVALQVRKQVYKGVDFNNIVIRKEASGALLKLKDIATINDGFSDEFFVSWVNGLPAIFLQVEVSDNPDILKTNQVVSDYVAEKNRLLPEGVALKVLYNLADTFKDRANTLIKNGIGGLLLVFLVLMLFLRPLLALWVCIGIGVAFLGAFWLMPVFSTSLNMMSLFAFLMILGIVVDDAIIVCESIYSEQEKHGLGIKTASLGAQKVSKPILFAVVSTMLVFVPMLLLSGSAAEAIKSLPIVVLVCLLFSLIESFFILPSHLAHMPKEGHFKNRFSRTLDNIRQRFSNLMNLFIHRLYKPALGFCLKHTLPSIMAFIAAFFIVLSTFSGGWIESQFMPDITTDFIDVSINIPPGEPDASKLAIAEQLQTAVKKMQETTRVSHSGESVVQDSVIWSENTGVKGFILVDHSLGSQLTNAEIADQLRMHIGEVKMAKSIDFSYKLIDSGKPIQLTLSSENKMQLQQAAEALKRYIATFAGTYDISDSFDLARSEVQLSLKDERAFSIWDNTQLGSQIRNAFYGTEVQRIPRDGEDIKIMLRLSRADREQVDSLESLPIKTNATDSVRLGAIADIDYAPSEIDIKRLNRQRTVTISAALKPDTSNAAEVIEAVITEFKDNFQSQFPQVNMGIQGEEKERQEFSTELSLLFIQAILAIYVIMAIAFRSYWQPIIILTAIPFGAMGAIIGHLIMGISISSYSFFGILACAGVVVNDNLVLIDRINQLRTEGVRQAEAVFQAGIDRFRPIILTSLTTFIGLIPIMSETSIQAQFLIPMVVSLAFGVLFATAVTLFLVPCLYLLGEKAKDRFSLLQAKVHFLLNKNKPV